MLAPPPTAPTVPPTSADLPMRVVVAFLAGLVARLSRPRETTSEQIHPDVPPGVAAETLTSCKLVLDSSVDGWPTNVIPDLLLRRVLADGAPLLTGADVLRVLESAQLPASRLPGGAYADLDYLLARARNDHPVPAALLAAVVAKAMAPSDATVPLLAPAAAPALDALRESLWRTGLHSWDTAVLFGGHAYLDSSRLFEARDMLARIRTACLAVVEIRDPGLSERERRATQQRERRRERAAEHRVQVALTIAAAPRHGRYVGRTSSLLCENRLTLRGPVSVRAEFMGAVAGTPPSEVRRPAAGTPVGCPSHPLSLQKGLPMPYELLIGRASERELWAVENWGSPWDVEGPFRFVHGADEYVFEFRTLCVPPLEWFDALADRYPLLTFSLESDMRAFGGVVTHRWREGLRQTARFDVEDYFWTSALSTHASVRG